ncbi:hypothetical protein E9099_01860 [Psychroserpens sp. NJDZ02]|nr:hypothetical protein E9099_01860 [Psychroserpens sp. NJDZ02]
MTKHLSSIQLKVNLLSKKSLNTFLKKWFHQKNG